MKKRAFLCALQRSVPVLFGYLFVGIAYGVMAVGRGVSAAQTIGMSLLIYAGSMQFVAVELLVGAAGAAQTALMTLFVNLRHLFYGLSMLLPYRGTGAKKPYLIFGLSDETFSLVVGQVPDGIDRGWYCFFVTLLDQCYWLAGSALGALMGRAVPFPTDGIEFVMTALFVVIFVDQWREKRNRIPAAIGVAVSLLALVLTDRASFLLPAMAGIAVMLFLLRGRLERKEKTI